MPQTGYFFVEPDCVRVQVAQEAVASVMPYLLGRVLGLWLEMQGVPLLHGACLHMGPGALGLLGQSGMGKSTLSAAMLKNGYALLSDDLIPLESSGKSWEIAPGIQQLRIWPDSGQQFFEDFESFDRVHPSYEKRKVQPEFSSDLRMSTTPATLSALVVLERVNGDQDSFAWTRLHGAEAMVALIANSYNVEALEALGWQRRRLQKLASLCDSLPVWRLRYPSGYESLPEIVADLGQRWGTV